MAEFEEQLNAILGDPGAMGQIMALAQSLQKGTAGPEAPPPSAGAETAAPASAPPAPPIDPRLLSLGMKVWQEYQRGDDRNTALLAALRPFVREERWARLDKAMQLARMARVIRMALGAFGKGEEDHL